MPDTNQKPARHSCSSLGICQTRLNPCEGCTWAKDAAARVARHAFAPGVITAYTPPRQAQVRRWVRNALTAAVGMVVLAMVAGYLVGSFLRGV